ncbi:helix-turn-helix domain-containing protein [Stenotrophomonas maltophilia]|uniref:helix-turn-helix domain-containing protein n=1 Tax=Stenotrophomonas maltophilia TaxID=40324 RepID=UPI00320113A9|nr:helix-turn-helix domain-containing protein [Stenotrophomonas maltophilia]
MESSHKLLTLAQAADLCACHPRTLRRAINDGHLTAMRLGQSAKSDRIHVADLEAWWQRSRYVPPPMPFFPKATFIGPLVSDADERLEKLFATKPTKSAAKTAAVRRKKK